MKKTVLLVLSLILAICALTACRRNPAGETAAPTGTTAGTQQTQGTTEGTRPTVTQPTATRPTATTPRPTDNSSTPSDGSNATDGDGIIDDNTASTGRDRRMMPRF